MPLLVDRSTIYLGNDISLGSEYLVHWEVKLTLPCLILIDAPGLKSQIGQETSFGQLSKNSFLLSLSSYTVIGKHAPHHTIPERKHAYSASSPQPQCIIQNKSEVIVRLLMPTFAQMMLLMFSLNA